MRTMRIFDLGFCSICRVYLFNLGTDWKIIRRFRNRGMIVRNNYVIAEKKGNFQSVDSITNDECNLL